MKERTNRLCQSSPRPVSQFAWGKVSLVIEAHLHSIRCYALRIATIPFHRMIVESGRASPAIYQDAVSMVAVEINMKIVIIENARAWRYAIWMGTHDWRANCFNTVSGFTSRNFKIEFPLWPITVISWVWLLVTWGSVEMTIIKAQINYTYIYN